MVWDVALICILKEMRRSLTDYTILVASSFNHLLMTITHVHVFSVSDEKQLLYWR